MDFEKTTTPMGHSTGRSGARNAEGGAGEAIWTAPRFEVISLCCEITAYAPDDDPLF